MIAVTEVTEEFVVTAEFAEFARGRDAPNGMPANPDARKP